jgi:hypothetical protein
VGTGTEDQRFPAFGRLWADVAPRQNDIDRSKVCTDKTLSFSPGLENERKHGTYYKNSPQPQFFLHFIPG